MAQLSARRKQQIVGILAANFCLVATLVAVIVGASLLSAVTEDRLVLSTVPLLAASLAVTGLAIALHPQVSMNALGLGLSSGTGLAWGALAGAAAAAMLSVSAIIAGQAAWVPWDPGQVRFDWTQTPLLGVALLAVGATGEELFMRGPLLLFLARAVGPAGGVALTSLAFALLHGANPGVTHLAQLNTALFGAVFGLAVVRRRSLWLAVGLHFGWNAGQVALGGNNSGITIRLTGLNLDLHGAEWLTGGDYGLEGGALATCGALLLATAVWCLPGPRTAEPPYGQAPEAAKGQDGMVEAAFVSGLLGGVARTGGDSPRQDREADGGSAS